jgi:hypothetical protein
LTATGGKAPYTFAITSGSLPSGLTLNTSSGAITGTPTKTGTYSFTAKVTDSMTPTAGQATVSCSITITWYALPAVQLAPAIAIAPAADGTVVITWTGSATLQSSTNLVQPIWTPLPEATSPYTNAVDGPGRFFRLSTQ